MSQLCTLVILKHIVSSIPSYSFHAHLVVNTVDYRERIPCDRLILYLYCSLQVKEKVLMLQFVAWPWHSASYFGSDFHIAKLGYSQTTEQKEFQERRVLTVKMITTKEENFNCK